MANMVVCPEPPAAKVGQEIFAMGGNAVDAAVATAFAQSVTNPLLCGLGGTGLWNYYAAETGQNLILNSEVSIGSCPVPEEWETEFIGRAETIGRYAISSEGNQVGYQSVMTPGFVRGCWTAFERFGSGLLSWTDLLSPAASLAKDGFEVYPYIAAFWQLLEDRPAYPGLMRKLQVTPDAARLYLKPDGSLFEQGDRLMLPDLAHTIQRLAEAGGEEFYTGEIAQAISEDFAQHQGLFTFEDLRDYTVEEEEPLSGQYRGLKVSSAPYSGGAQVIQMLLLIERFEPGRLGHNSPEYIDLLSRIQRATFIDCARMKGLSKEDATRLQREIISRERIDYWSGRIKSGDRIEVRGGAVDTGTTHLTCIDAAHNVVSFTHSIGSLAGSGVVTPGLGFIHNNFLGHFHPLPGHPDSIVPGKRLSGVVPTILFKDGHPYIAIGAPGGSRIITAVVQSILNVVDHGMDMKTAVSVPRFHSEEKQLLYLEPAFPESSAEALRDMGNTVERSTYMSRVQAVRVQPESGELEAGPDPRGGAGVGYHD
jgi:gamma-glutamyltranspeptidase/glutathione hydrolase